MGNILSKSIRKLFEIFSRSPSKPRPMDPIVAERILDDLIEESKNEPSAPKFGHPSYLQELKARLANMNSAMSTNEDEEEPIYANIRQMVQEINRVDMVHKINIFVIGSCKAGKSTLVNSMRGLRAHDRGAAPVGPNEILSAKTSYEFPGHEHIVFWDNPGYDTQSNPRGTYFKRFALRTADHLLIVFTEKLGESELYVIKEAIASRVPFSLVRNKVDIDLANSLTDLGPSVSVENVKANLIWEHHKKATGELQRAGIDQDEAKVFLVNSRAFVERDTVKFEEEQLKLHILSDIKKRRYEESGGGAAIKRAAASARAAVSRGVSKMKLH